ncbi:PopZ family protein [Mesorhizobium qingshengii]|uniref:PopZ family protein n=1 Tax=Mesorhizobium qingshengii TaxID=1165689 RepID=A0ABT4QT65_9HYPH|nr:PopZ family protein [Mesorhizobium qingshengii]MCZ8544772.1 PopZ family protein [Mesorhizobium qingshengii]
MATASSAQREPSMEEILASIRRIIEDSDTGRKQPGEADEPRQDMGSSADPAPDVEAFRADLHAAPEVRKPVKLAEVQALVTTAEPVIGRMETSVRPEPTPARPSMTLAEVSARVAAEPAPLAAAEAPAARAVANPDASVADWRREIAAVGEQAQMGQDRGEARKPVAQAQLDNPGDEPNANRAFEQSRPGGSPARPVVSSDAPSARPAIVSEHTGRQVAAAFGELSDAFASRSKKTFDEMAEEMLRPMLQDWLDNNLPTLVERLVREEIERVARGAQ